MLWMVENGHAAPINSVHKKLILSFTDPVSGETRLGQVNKSDRESNAYEIQTEDGIIYNVPIANTNKIDLRSKAYHFLASAMDMPLKECQIPQFSTNMVYKAIDILETVTKNLNIKQKENESNN